MDSSQKSHSRAKEPDAGMTIGLSGDMEVEEEQHLSKYVLQDPLWLLPANVDGLITQTYQMPPW